MTPLLKVSSLQVWYGAVQAVRGIDIEVQEGEIVAFLGANGAGKSSTLNAIAGLVPASEGKIEFSGRDVTDLAPEALTPMGLALSPEGRRVFPALSVSENLLMGAYSVKDKQAIAAAWDRVYSLFPILHERKDQLAGTLSGGQQQMLAVGRALMSGPKLLLLDEPSLGLAPKIVEQIFELITILRDQKVTIALVEQNVAKSLEIADRGYIIAGGQVVGQGRVEDLRSQGGLEETFLGA
ncbi:ABC transporter ATP-binding protein [Cohaesibacter celericrescens]|uniref:ABC transporter ATP-binding protein n=1 Tax=Cohaesibacter celericrescens TaxID=2067669 RepID=A0A2N5XW98_9HYPH|nr:ABC transporter ATP-binding protein [Cohaesibacter celericrescens]PLW78759.1 ABC transporter ATP-binding protein [Cohaesibacter celericrescens]